MYICIYVCMYVCLCLFARVCVCAFVSAFFSHIPHVFRYYVGNDVSARDQLVDTHASSAPHVTYTWAPASKFAMPNLSNAQCTRDSEILQESTVFQ